MVFVEMSDDEAIKDEPTEICWRVQSAKKFPFYDENRVVDALTNVSSRALAAIDHHSPLNNAKAIGLGRGRRRKDVDSSIAGVDIDMEGIDLVCHGIILVLVLDGFKSAFGDC